MSDGDVVSLHGKPIFAKGIPNQDVIDMLTGCLELARRGEIHGCHAVLVHDDGVARKATIGRCNYAAIGALAVLSASVISQGLDD